MSQSSLYYSRVIESPTNQLKEDIETGFLIIRVDYLSFEDFIFRNLRKLSHQHNIVITNTTKYVTHDQSFHHELNDNVIVLIDVH